MPTSHINTLHSSAYVRMCVANALVCTYVFSLIPVFYARTGSLPYCAAALVLFSLGMVVPGPFNAWMMERFSRKTVYLRSLLGLALLGGLLEISPEAALGVCFLQGVAFSMSQNALGHTLVNDLLSSERRTAGDNLYSWYGRFGLPFGWMWGCWLANYWPAGTYWLALLPVAAAYLLIVSLSVPVKAPVPARLLSLDRFWQPAAWPLFVMALAAAALESSAVALAFWSAEGLLDKAFFMSAGFLVALWLQRVVFAQAVDKAEMVAGAVLTLAAFWMMGHELRVVGEVAFVFLGAGIGMLSGRLLLYFLKLCGHCQRGTSQNTYMLGWRAGIALGFLLTSLALQGAGEGAVALCEYAGIAVTAAYLLAYLCWIHPWFERHRDRDFKFREGM